MQIVHVLCFMQKPSICVHLSCLQPMLILTSEIPILWIWFQQMSNDDWNECPNTDFPIKLMCLVIDLIGETAIGYCVLQLVKTWIPTLNWVVMRMSELILDAWKSYCSWPLDPIPCFWQCFWQEVVDYIKILLLHRATCIWDSGVMETWTANLERNCKMKLVLWNNEAVCRLSNVSLWDFRENLLCDTD